MNIKAAILGAGFMGKTHAKNLTEIGVEIAAVCDESLQALSALKEHVDNHSFSEFDDFDAMLEQADFDVLFICIPPFAQKGQFEKAAKKGKHIFIEKPIALNTKTGKSMLEAAKGTGIITQVGFHMRFGTAVNKLREMAISGEAGKPVLFNGQYECNSLHAPWWRKAELSGGQILEQAIHLYDTCRFLFGNPASVSGLASNVCHTDTEGYTIEDVSASNALFEGGAVASITATNCAVPGNWEEKFSAVYENVTVFFKNPNKALFVYTQNGEAKKEAFEKNVDVKLEEDRDFINRVMEKRPSACPIDEGYYSLCYVEAVTDSAKEGGAKKSVKY